MKVCSNCGIEVNERREFCVLCRQRYDGLPDGAAVSDRTPGRDDRVAAGSAKKVCSNCGTEVNERREYCVLCRQRYDGMPEPKRAVAPRSTADALGRSADPAVAFGRFVGSTGFLLKASVTVLAIVVAAALFRNVNNRNSDSRTEPSTSTALRTVTTVECDAECAAWVAAANATTRAPAQTTPAPTVAPRTVPPPPTEPEVVELRQGCDLSSSGEDPNDPGAFPDLQGRDLSLCDLRGVDLSYRDMSGADFQGADLRGADLSNAPPIGPHLRDSPPSRSRTCRTRISPNRRSATR